MKSHRTASTFLNCTFLTQLLAEVCLKFLDLGPWMTSENQQQQTAQKPSIDEHGMVFRCWCYLLRSFLTKRIAFHSVNQHVCLSRRNCIFDDWKPNMLQNRFCKFYVDGILPYGAVRNH
mmetsp:Transcript_18741/g.52384  ORF Transcript_18741/g.52384 Transcript_18741/m.52384 type:complete len:119 (+) Transcript_18741:2243-2599(+)